MLKRWFSRLATEQKGFTFIEVLVGIAIMSIIVAAFLLAMTTAYKANMISQVRTTADSIARTQMEYIKAQPYSDSYTPFWPDEEDPQQTDLWEDWKNYSIFWLDEQEEEHFVDLESEVNCDIFPILLDDGLQKIYLSIKHHDKDVLMLEGYKVNR